MLNKVILIGRLTKDPEMRVSTTGNAVGTFSLAVGRNFAGPNGEKETDFFNCVCYKKLAEIVGRYVKKGSLISVEGRIQNRSYDGQDGVKKYITEIICDNVVFLDTKSSQNDYSQNNYPQGNYQQNNQFQQQQPSFNQQQPTMNVPQQQNKYNNPTNNQSFNNNNNNKSQPKDDYFNDNPNVDISEDDLPF
ncbi:MAG: single-stranded DNA-binding protein [Haloplasmataceae bacterium]|nr:single-stranded DNA-binding protein [Haloplasmataceae bacterium]